MTPIVLRYPEDMTGTSPNNLVLNELHQTPNTRIRAIAPLHGPFYSQSVVLKDALTDEPLIKGQDYFCVEYYEIPSLKSGKEVCAIVLITNEAITANQFKLDYQVVGGEFSYSYDAIVELVNKVMDDTRPVSWPNIINIPPQFQPAPHRHDIGDTFGWEYIVSQLESVRKAILIGDSASHDEIYRYIDFRINNDILPLLNQANVELQAHITDFNNPHQVTKEQIGLSNIPNSISDSRALNEGNTLATSKAIFDHATGGDHDSRYVRNGSSPIVLQNNGNTLYATYNGITAQIWPPLWQ